MKKNFYQKPTMKAVRLHQRAKLLAGSGEGVNASRKSYGTATTEEWGCKED